MPDLGPHALFILAAYGVTFVAVGALAFATIADDRKQRRLLADLERRGIRRRSATPPKPATASAKAKPAKAPVKKPRAPSARKRKP
jgi:heme exporter protein D